MLDQICQIIDSIWAENDGVRDLVVALNEIFRPQASLCSFGRNKTIERAKEFLEERVAASVAHRGAA